jgi:hypothetical protein
LLTSANRSIDRGLLETRFNLAMNFLERENLDVYEREKIIEHIDLEKRLISDYGKLISEVNEDNFSIEKESKQEKSPYVVLRKNSLIKISGVPVK